MLSGILYDAQQWDSEPQAARNLGDLKRKQMILYIAL